MAAVYAIGSLTFPSGEQPTDGSNELAQPQKWVEFEPIGASTPGTLLTYISSPSIKQTMTVYASAATKNSLITIYNARATVTWTTPDDGTGYLVMMTALSVVRDRSTRGTGRYKCTFTIVKQQ